jgi:signal transduction histidine kinase
MVSSSGKAPAEDSGQNTLAEAHERTQWALRERVKELSCLYSIAQLAERGGPLGQMLEGIAALLPAAWQYPESAHARLVFDGGVYGERAGENETTVQTALITIGGQERGRVEVAYDRVLPEQYEGPFLLEERNLINEVSRQVSFLVTRREIASERERLLEKLRGSERLAAAGQLAAGVAHELNEPLGAILGYAQLIQKSFGLPDQTARDLDRIVKASLHARQIVRNLLLFARQVPPRLLPVDLNRVVREVLFFMQSRIARSRARLEVNLAAGLPPVLGDATHLQQVVVNLVSNAVQSMPEGGILTVQTRVIDTSVAVSVADTGAGMSEELRTKIFDPFFTTKEIGRGTGLGLAVLHGIVESHHGHVSVTSSPGKGSCFDVRFPRADLS